MQAFAIVHPIVEIDHSVILEFVDETEPLESRRYRLFLQKVSLQELKLIVYRPKKEIWQDITSMISPFYLASLKNVLLDQIKSTTELKDNIS
ncbi:hypothetical protein [Sutcliffiella deserti]|uniref:hypothetical protein n=1 Tax=Sutcliffiella deserti TaxID=2875501 RepID=UPI001CBCA5C0|nr:hypothetical protein [Sutcliffiella deserti]